MSDETKADTVNDSLNADRESAQAAENARQKEAAAKPKRNYKAKDAPAEGPGSAERLRAFEDEVFGKRAVRINGQIERGVGSPYAAMTDERKAQYAAIEDIMAAEQRLNDATAAAAAAEADRLAAEERLASCEKVAQEKDAAAEAEKAEIEKEKASVAG